MHSGPVRAVLRACENSRRPLLLAVSGGLDSMVLLHAALDVGRSRIAAVATFDHGTGAPAKSACRHVEAITRAAGVPFATARMGTIPRSGDGREAAWRDARHAFLRETAGTLDAVIVTAHTEDDQVETVLMRLIRGSGARGLAGLYTDGPICRPFIALRRRQLERYAKRAAVTFVEDPSNASREFFRNRVRNDLLPAFRRVDQQFDDSLLALARRAAALRRDVEEFVTAEVRPEFVDRARLVVASDLLREYDPPSASMLWSALAGRIGLALDRRGTRRIAEFTTMKPHPRSGSIPLAGGWCLEATRTTYILQRATTVQNEPVELPLRGTIEWGRFRFRTVRSPQPETPWSASLTLSAGTGLVRSWVAGDRLQPSRGQARRRVKRYLSDAGVQGWERSEWPVVVSGDDVVWIPGVRRSDAATERSGRPVRHYVCERIDR